jgi:hypothetical protein
VDTLGHLLALRVSPADEQDRAQVEELARSVQEATGESVELAYADRGATPAKRRPRRPKLAASGWRCSGTPGPKRASSCCLEEVGGGALLRVGDEVQKARQGLPEVARNGGGGLHFVAFACLFLHRAIAALVSGP